MNTERWIALGFFVVFVAYVVWDHRHGDEPFFDPEFYIAPGVPLEYSEPWSEEELDRMDDGMWSTLAEIASL